ncbi:MAG: PD-(D/E)XK nuclease family protein [Candidatus Omnitrophica bacterium]|nr:PD-(D/E)XK nuclease family protein [Candidatus Omnitrophota bacterium]
MSKIFTIDFTRSFIDELVAYIDREYLQKGRSLERLMIVFGGQRPEHFLKRALAQKTGKAFVPPRFVTIDAFMDAVAGGEAACRVSGDLEARYDIFLLAQALTPELLEGREAFAKFLPWAGDILDFIHQMDLEDVSAAALKDIEASARIGYSVPENINRLLEKVLVLREAFHARLKEKKRTSRGLQYLRAKENVAAFDTSAFDEIIFANFFYFHRTEEVVVKALYQEGKATLIFQGDERKWPVLKRIAGRLGCSLVEGDVPTPVHFELKAYSAFDVHSEAGVVRDILSRTKDMERTVVVLPDTGALLPLLSTFPDEVSDFNVSMGYPLKRGSLYLLLRAVFKAQASRRDGRYYAKDYLSVLLHPLVKNMCFGAKDPEPMRKAAHHIEDLIKKDMSSALAGRAFIHLKDVEAEKGVPAFTNRIHELFFTAWEGIRDVASFTAVLEDFLAVLGEEKFLKNYPLNVNIALRMHEIREEFARASFAQEPFAAADIFRIFEERLERELVSFSGTPLKGLQVLGLFETRSLHFNNVIIMDVNEGVLPRINARASLIPREVMSRLGLDRLELEEEIQRYQFMRLISSAKTVHLVYQKNKEKEPSRFLEEIVWEKQLHAGRLDPYPTMRAGFGARSSGVRREVKKTARMMQFLKGFAYSASSINAYLANPYQFYTDYVLGLREAEDLLDEPDAALVGNFMHDFLEKVFYPYVGKPLGIDADFEARFWRMFDTAFNDAFEQRMRSDAFLVRGVMEHKLKAFLEQERERSVFLEKVLAIEQDYSGSIVLKSGTVAFKARVDRIDALKSGELLVLDYKTGVSDELPGRAFVLSDDPTREEIFDRVGSFQLPLYMYFAGKAFPGAMVNAGLYSVRTSEIKTIFTDKYPARPVDEFLSPYLEALSVVVAEILNPDKPFIDDDLRNLY